MFTAVPNHSALLCCLLCFGNAEGMPAAAMDLPDLQATQADLRDKLRARPDSIAWYDFDGPANSDLKFEPGPDKGVLTAREGYWRGQKAINIFHGLLRGPAIHIPDSGFTLCCWLRVNDLEKVDRLGYNRSAGGVMAVGSGYYHGWRMAVTPGSSTLSFELGRPEVGARRLASTGYLTTGRWHHVAITWDRETLAMWIDGILRAESEVAMAYHRGPEGAWFRIGECDSGLGVLNFDIADVGIFGTALPADLLQALGDPDLQFRKEITRFFAQVVPPSGRGEDEDSYRRQFAPFLARSGSEGSPALEAARSMARLRVAESFRREGLLAEATRSYTELADDVSAALHHRARAMLALGDIERDQRKYASAREAYRKMQEFFVARHEAFRAAAIERLREIDSLADGEPLRDDRRRRIDRISHPASRLFVAPDGDDANPGTDERPLRTLERARDAVREVKRVGPLPDGGVAVLLKAGVYPRETESFVLSADDSGTLAAPVVYQAAPGATPILRGGRVIRGFAPLTDPVGRKRIPAAAQQHVRQIDLKAAGVADFGVLRPRGKSIGGKDDPNAPAHLELLFNGEPMPLARWPNDTRKMSERFTTVELSGQETEKDHGRTVARESDVFSYSNPRQDAWADESDAWVFGCWQYLFYGSYMKVAGVDAQKRTIRVDWNRTTPYELKRREFALGAPYQGINLLCELDAPGEWHLDRDRGVLFFWPPGDLAGSETIVSILEQPMIRLEGASHVVFRGLTLEAGRQHGVVIQDGESVLLAGCTIRNLGVTGVEIGGGTNHEVVGCDLAYLGDAGIKVSGGNREDLTPSGHVIENCHIHHFARWNRIGYQAGVEMSGVGNRVSHCLVNDAPHQAFLVHGNDNVLEYSEIHDVCHEAGDAGAYYMYGEVSVGALLELGQVVRYNYWHDLPHNETFKKVANDTRRGIYIDSFNSNITVYGNIFQRFHARSGAVYFGACDNRVENNVFHRCFTGVNLSDRTYLYGLVNKPPNFPVDTYVAKAAANPVWARRYPRLTQFPRQAADTSIFLQGNVVARNLVYECETFLLGSDRTRGLARIEQNWTEGDPGFQDPNHGDFSLRADSPVFAACDFEPLPLDRIGLYQDELRATWPVGHESGLYETRLVDDEAIKRLSAGEMPVCHASQATSPIVIDGRLEPVEWDGLEKAEAVVVSRTPGNTPTAAHPSYLWLRHDREWLYVAILNELNPGETPKPKPAQGGSWWQNVDMAEIIFEGPFGKNAYDWWPKDRPHGPLFYLVGDCAGQMDSICLADLPAARAAGLRGAVHYAAAAEPGRWTAEWQIPLTAIGLSPTGPATCAFNAGVLKPGTRPPVGTTETVGAGDLWAVWRGTSGANWQVWNAGLLYLGGR